MQAYEFLAHDMSGLILAGNTDNQCEWLGTQEQWANAEMQMLYFQENDMFYKVDEDYE